MSFHLIRLSIIAFLLHAGVTVVSAEDHSKGRSVSLEVLAPKHGAVAGVGSRAFLVDLVAHFEGNFASTDASPELTGPGAQANQPPFPGTFGIGANLDHFPGLVVLLSSSTVGAGPGQNLANLFNIVAITDRRDDDTDVSATWIIGAPAFGQVGQHTPSRLFVAVVQGPAPNVLEDRDGNGHFDEKDLRLMGFQIISNVKKVSFIVNGLP